MKRPFNLASNLLVLVSLLSLIGGSYIAFTFIAKNYALPPRLFMLKILKKVGLESSVITQALTPPSLRSEDLVFPSLDKPGWQGHGAREDRKLAPVNYDFAGRPVPLSWIKNKDTSISPEGASLIVPVQNSEEFLQAFRQALPGDIIILSPGKYTIKKRSIYVSSGGTLMQPITVKAERLGDVFLELDSLEGFVVNSPYWIFENLDIKGVCNNDDDCEHAFHLVGKGHGFVLRNSRIHEFSSPIKANRFKIGDAPRIGPEGVLLEGNSFYNTRARQTSKPVTFIDVVGSNHFILSNNLIADFQKAHEDHISYGAQIKGNSTHGVFEKNLVVCEYETTGGVRVGLSFGGGGTGRKFLEPGDIYEHSKGIVRNNIVMYCSDVGLYLNKAHETQVYNNTFYATNGIDVRFPESTALIVNNLVSGNIWDRNGGTSIRRNNLVRDINGWPLSFRQGFNDWFVDPAVADFRLKNGEKIVNKGEATSLIWEDFCGNQRNDMPDIGAMEYGIIKPCRPLGKIE
jgi:parallel beta-helix repeat protein